MFFNFLKYKKIYFFFSGILILASIGCLIVFGLKWGIEFTGGSVLKIEYRETRPGIDEIKEALASFNLQETVQPLGEKGVVIKMKYISDDVRKKIIEKLKEKGEIEEKIDFESIGPVIGQEIKEKTKIAIVLALIAILLYIAFAFRRVSYPVKSWQYGISALIALFHDILIPLGVFSLLGKFYNIQITIPVITALLTILGYSINDTVVVFDRIRENLLKREGVTFEDTVNLSLNQTLTRSINTSLTTLFALFAIFFFGGETLRYFSLTLILGIISGTYSSIFLASPFIVSWRNWQEKRKL
ncbi:protein translocase subunit SecF [bacterium]|nr:protein translocase subunit SecF [bacterium]